MSESTQAPSADGLRRRQAAQQALAAGALAAVAAADEDLPALAGRRVAAEQALRQAVVRHHAAVRAVAAHVQARPGRFRRLAAGWRADRDWAERLLALSALQAETEPPLAAAAAALTRVKDGFAARVQARAEAAAELRAATARCAEVSAELSGCDNG